MIHIILLAGGKSLRLWPFSDETHAKQFLCLLDDGNGGKESMIQRMYRQVRAEFLEANVVIATNKEQEKEVREQLGKDICVVCEPQRCDTFAAIALAAAFLYTKKGGQEDDVIVVLPADGYVEQTYFSTIRDMVNLAALKVAKLILMGIKPTGPSPQFGYIVPASFQSGYASIECFVEKPTEEKAQELLNKGAHWNGGVFVFTLGYLAQIIQALGQDFSFTNLYNSYTTLPRKSFDYIVVEKEDSLAMVPYAGLWKDLGTWESFSSVLKEQELGSDEQTTTIVNYLDLPIITLGTKNLIIAANSNGILIADKQASNNLKSIAEKLPSAPADETQILAVQRGKSLKIATGTSHKTLVVLLVGSGYITLENPTKLEVGVPIELLRAEEYTLQAETDLRLVKIRISDEL